MSDPILREYGSGDPTIIAIHGGPAAAGDLEPLARRVGEGRHVLEPYQRGSGGPALTVAVHVQDLHDLIRERCDQPPVLVGHSWGAMLALAYAAAHPDTTCGVVLVGCGTFSPAARGEFEARLEARLTPADRAALATIDQTETDANRRLGALGRLMTRVYGHDIDEPARELVVIDAVAHRQTWDDMVRLQHGGVYPAAFAAITCPVLMLHGAADPHPGPMIRDDIRPWLPQLEYRELARCGHSPWLERQARDEFFAVLDAWISAR